MKIIKKKKRHIVIVFLSLFALASALTGVYLLNKQKTESVIDTSTSEKSTKTVNPSSGDSQQKQEYLDAQNKSSDDSESSQDSDDNISSESLSLKATTDGDNVVITTNLSSITSGNCSLSISNGMKSASQTAEVIFTPEYSSCAGFTVAKDELGTGRWSISLNVTTNSNTYTKIIEYNVT